MALGMGKASNAAFKSPVLSEKEMGGISCSQWCLVRTPQREWQTANAFPGSIVTCRQDRNLDMVSLAKAKDNHPQGQFLKSTLFGI